LSGILKAPWQVGLAVAATFLVAADYIGQALIHLALISENDSLEQARQAGIVHMVHEYDSVLGVFMIDDISARVFFAVGAGLLIMGVFLWVGAFRGGVRGILTVPLVVSLLRGIIPLALSFDPANGLDLPGLVEAEFNNVIALIAALLLWGKAGKKWVAMGAKKKWDQD